MPDSRAPELLTTTRLRLQPLAAADLAAVHAIFADPGTWAHLPSGRHTAFEQAERMLDESEQSRAASGLGRWAIRLRNDLPGRTLPAGMQTALPAGTLTAGTLIGVASAMLMDCGARNLGYRLTPASWGIGLATEAAAAVLAAAQKSTYPVTARVLAGNPASVRVLERIGLTLAWRGRGVPGAVSASSSSAVALPARATPAESATAGAATAGASSTGAAIAGASSTGPSSTGAAIAGASSAGASSAGPSSAGASSTGAAPAAAAGQVDTTALERLVFTDRPLAPELLAAVIRLG